MSCSEEICRRLNPSEGKVEAMGGRAKKVKQEELEGMTMVEMGGRKGGGEEREVGGVKLMRRSC